jgi:WD40 repeat protein
LKINIKTIFAITGLALLLNACQLLKNKIMMSTTTDFSKLKEVQLTYGEKGHFLHIQQAFSPNNEWLVYDTRNDETHISRTSSIEMVNANSKEIISLYNTKNQTVDGPGVGGVSFNPKRNQVLFIHGLQNCGPNKPYGFSRRTGVSIKTDYPQKPIYLDARDVTNPYTPGALRGGTHAHSWSRDGQWITFTYNDYIMSTLAENPNSGVKDLRMVGVMAPIGSVKVDHDEAGENNNGEMFSVVVSEVFENPKLGSDQIDRSYCDAWIGETGYIKSNGEKQKRAIAFLGDTRDSKGNKLTEVYLVDIPEDITKSAVGKPIEGTESTRPMPPLGTVQKRLTYTQNRKYPGVQGPFHFVKSLPDGSMLFFMMKDDNGIVQVYGIDTNDGTIKQMTTNKVSIETSFDLSPDGKFLAYGINETIWITEVANGSTLIIPNNSEINSTELSSINWSHDGKNIAYKRKVTESGTTSYYQIFILK